MLIVEAANMMTKRWELWKLKDKNKNQKEKVTVNVWVYNTV